MRRGVGALVLAGGSLIALFGTMLPWSILRAPWIATGELRRSGLDSDGVLAALAAVVCLLLVLPAWRWRGVSAVTGLLAAYVTVVGLVRWRDISGRTARSGLDAVPLQVGDGIWFTIGGGVVMLAGASILLFGARGRS